MRHATPLTHIGDHESVDETVCPIGDGSSETEHATERSRGATCDGGAGVGSVGAADAVAQGWLHLQVV